MRKEFIDNICKCQSLKAHVIVYLLMMNIMIFDWFSRNGHGR